MKTMRKASTAILALLIGIMMLITSCGSKAAETTEAAPAASVPAATTAAAKAKGGALLLSVNPKIRIGYDDSGKVTDIKGNNEDGKKIVAAYQDFIGKDADLVLQELLQKIHEAGYFVEDLNGRSRSVILQVEQGSKLPDASFMNDVRTSAEDAVKRLSLSSSVVTIDENDYDQKYARDGKPSPYISLTKAKEIALGLAGIDLSKAKFDDREFDFDDGVAIYELEFKADGFEYEFKIDAKTGEILKYEIDRDDDDKVTNPKPSGSKADSDDDDDRDDDDDDDWDDDYDDDWDDDYDDDDYDDDWDDDDYDDDDDDDDDD
jgi:uncharacterized membrane protein YkoI